MAYGSLSVRLASGDTPLVAIGGSAHWLSAGAAILAAWGVAHLVAGTGGWPASGFVATAVYLPVNSAQVTAAQRSLSPSG